MVFQFLESDNNRKMREMLLTQRAEAKNKAVEAAYNAGPSYETTEAQPGEDIYSPSYDPDAAKHKAQRDQNDEYNYGGNFETTQAAQNDSNEKQTTGNIREEWDHSNKAFTFELVRAAIVGPGNITEEVTLFINPESFQQAEPTRVNVIQTKGGFFADNFGAGLKTITMAGHLGYRGNTRVQGRNGHSGTEQFMLLRTMYRDWQASYEASGANPAEMRFYNWADEEYYEVVINSFQLQRTTAKPLIYQYNIQMTVLKKLEGDKRSQYTGEGDFTKFLLDPTDRLPLVSEKLNSSLETVQVMSTMTEDNFGQIIQNGLYQSTQTGVFGSIRSVIGLTEDVARGVSQTAAGLTVFITTPFELVKQLGASIGDVCDSLCALASVPHEMVRAFRDMQCSLNALPSSLFEGFTNPSLFEGASNCGTTLGIREAAVSGYKNSFSSTAKLPPERPVSEIFRSPSSKIALKEEPTDVAGVFLESDIERIGINYLSSSVGSVVTLADVPTVPVVVDYSIRQETAQDQINLTAAAAYIVLMNDTVPRISLNFYGDASRWKDIALFNDLEYPYIMPDLDFEKEIYATGTVRFYRNFTVTAAISIPIGQLVYVPAHDGNRPIEFLVSATTTLPAMTAYVDAPVEAVLFGTIGNVAPKLITGFEPLTGISRVENLSPTLGGKVWKVATPGDVIFIPQTSRGEAISVVVSSKVANFEELFGIDIKVGRFGEFEFGDEVLKDLRKVVGVKNLVQALKNRMDTSNGYYPYNPTYGSLLPYYIGKKNLYRWQNRVVLEAKRNILDDRRIKNINKLVANIVGDSISVEFDAETIGEQSSLPMNIVI